MKILRPGHCYELQNFENPDAPGQVLQFIEKMPRRLSDEDGNTHELVLARDGTTNEEVLEVLIDRLECLRAKLPSKETACALTHLEEALMWLQRRTAKRQARGVEGTSAP